MRLPALMALASQAAQHAATRHAHAALNVANADTPDYRPTDLTPFDPFGAEGGMRATRPEHIAFASRADRRAVVQDGPLDPNGNGVVLETEILRSTEAQRAHSRAINVYQASMDILRASLGRGR